MVLSAASVAAVKIVKMVVRREDNPYVSYQYINQCGQNRLVRSQQSGRVSLEE